MSLDQKPPALAIAITNAYQGRPMGETVQLAQLLLRYVEQVISDTEALDGEEADLDDLAARHLIAAQVEIDRACDVMRRGDWWDPPVD